MVEVDRDYRGQFFLWGVGRLMMVDLGLFFRRHASDDLSGEKKGAPFQMVDIWAQVG